jgi:hypothetical protein
MEPVNLSSTPEGKSPEVTVEQPISIQERTPLHDRFNIVHSSPELDAQMKDIWAWAKAQSPVDDKDSILWEVTKLTQKLGMEGISDKPWAKILNYVRVWKQFRSAEDQLKQMENGRA